MKKYSKLVIHRLELNVFLGWGEEERSQKQPVWIDLHIAFIKPPKAIETDMLNDTFCYYTLTQKIADHISETDFRLIEHLSFRIYHLVKTFFNNESLIKVGLTKKPDIAYPNQGVTFWYGDNE